MTAYRVPLKDIQHTLFELLELNQHLPTWQHTPELDQELIEQVLQEAARFCEDKLLPINRQGDEQGCTLNTDTHTVTTPDGFKEAFVDYARDGWSALTGDSEYGGQAMPEVLGAAIKEMINAANVSWGTYPLLCHGAIESLKHHGTQAQKDLYLEPLITGQWTGTMCLTEAHAGSDLGLLSTKATPNDDGSHAINGSKIFITAGDHDFCDNIIHLVLARLPDAPAGVKGISLFIVPKFMVHDDGSLGERNRVHCSALEHKMGLKGSATCVLNFDDAKGFLLGEPHRGLIAMFTMMNAARLAVGIQGLGVMDRAYQEALAYSRDRLQMRAVAGATHPDKPADPIIEHADIRRMLLTCKAFIEGGRAMAYHAMMQLDISQKHSDEATRNQANALLGFVTPITKAILTEAATQCSLMAQQCFGGHGYIAEWGVEQLVRDARILSIYEGTTQIQALDLLGRKVLHQQGDGLKVFLHMVSEFCAEYMTDESLSNYTVPLAALIQDYQNTTVSLAERCQKDPRHIATAAHDYLWYSGYISLAYWLAKQVAVTQQSGASADRKQSKRAVADFYYERILPQAAVHSSGLRATPDVFWSMSAEQFDA